MTKQKHRIDRELLILLAILIALALAAHATGRSAGFEVMTETLPAITATAPDAHLHEGSTNPYWAPPRAFTRRPIPLYSNEAMPDLLAEASPHR